MDQPFIGTIILWSPTFSPRSWAYCAGQLLGIAQNSALFSLIGNTYGGDGQTTFALPDLRSRVAVGGGMGPGPGLSNVVLGERAGQEQVTLLPSNLPPHVHSGFGLEMVAYDTPATDSVPVAGHALASPNTQVGINTTPTNAYAAPGGQGVTLAAGTIIGNTGPAGSGIPFNNMQPYLGISYIIALFGIFPPRS